MPQRVTCNECGYVLYDGADLKPPDEVLQQCNGKCPGCDKKLGLVPLKVEVKPAK